MKRLYCIIASVCISSLLWALQPTCTIPLYPDGAPDSNGYKPEDEYVKEGTKIYKTSIPRIDVYLPNAADAAAPAILVCPGGGYQFTSTGNEGIDVANYFVPRGYAIAVLKYRMPNGHERIPLSDALQAMRLLRDSAAVWHIREQHIGVMGFSAGGHLAATLLTKYADAKTRPDYGVLVYPVITMDETLTHRGSCRSLLGEKPTLEQRLNWSAERNVTSDTPPCIIVVCQDDPTVKVDNSLLFYKALTNQHVPATLIVVPEGKHGWGYQRQFRHREIIDQAILSFVAEH
jgi:acetyl esterase/lipase